MAKLLALFAAVSDARAQRNLTSGADGTVYLIRHGEKDSDGCESSTGLQRGDNLYDCFASKFDVPEWVYAFKYNCDTCQRCEQTVHAISKAIGMSGPDMSYGAHDCKREWGSCTSWADAIMSKLSKHPVVLVAAEHGHIQYLAHDLGVAKADIPDWPGKDYDTVLKLKFSNSKLVFSVDKQGGPGPKPGPSPTPPPTPPTPPPTPPPSPSPVGADTLPSGKHLSSGESLVSASGQVILTMTSSDGNVEIKYRNTTVWSAGVVGHPGAEFYFQSSGPKLVVRDTDSTVLWDSPKVAGAVKAILRDDCDFWLTDDSGSQKLWSTGSTCASPESIVV